MRICEISDLPMDKESRMSRAKELGFILVGYHGTGSKFDEFDLDKGYQNTLSGYAPHFASTKAEAKGYAAARKKDNIKISVLDCLLRVKKPFLASYDNEISKKEFVRITGRISERPLPTTMDALRHFSKIYGYERDKYADRRMQWTLTYRRLIKLGYDAIIFENTPPDHSEKFYTKIVVFDPKNIRSVEAKFDPAQSNSANLMA